MSGIPEVVKHMESEHEAQDSAKQHEDTSDTTTTVVAAERQLPIVIQEDNVAMNPPVAQVIQVDAEENQFANLPIPDWPRLLKKVPERVPENLANNFSDIGTEIPHFSEIRPDFDEDTWTGSRNEKVKKKKATKVQSITVSKRPDTFIDIKKQKSVSSFTKTWPSFKINDKDEDPQKEMEKSLRSIPKESTIPLEHPKKDDLLGIGSSRMQKKKDSRHSGGTVACYKDVKTRPPETRTFECVDEETVVLRTVHSSHGHKRGNTTAYMDKKEENQSMEPVAKKKKKRNRKKSKKGSRKCSRK